MMLQLSLRKDVRRRAKIAQTPLTATRGVVIISLVNPPAYYARPVSRNHKAFYTF